MGLKSLYIGIEDTMTNKGPFIYKIKVERRNNNFYAIGHGCPIGGTDNICYSIETECVCEWLCRVIDEFTILCGFFCLEGSIKFNLNVSGVLDD